MRKIILFFVIQQLLYQVSRVESLIGNNIVQVKLGEFPFIATFQHFPEGDNFCGGVLISGKHVLTLSRCLEGIQLQSFRIVFEVARDPTLTAYTAGSWIKYDTWAERQHIASIIRDVHSMAIATLTDKVYHINPVALSGLSKIQLIGIEAQMIGFKDGVLSKATVKMLSNEDCERSMHQLHAHLDVSDSKWLYSAANPFALLSTGDRGSPLLHAHDNSLLGLASGYSPDHEYRHGNLSIEFIRQHQVNMHVSVYYHRAFIHSIIQSGITVETAPVA